MVKTQVHQVPISPRDAVARFDIGGEAVFVIPLDGESDYSAIRRMAAQLKVDPTSANILKNLK
jgi:putative heme degradation protein